MSDVGDEVDVVCPLVGVCVGGRGEASNGQCTDESGLAFVGCIVLPAPSIHRGSSLFLIPFSNDTGPLYGPTFALNKYLHSKAVVKHNQPWRCWIFMFSVPKFPPMSSIGLFPTATQEWPCRGHPGGSRARVHTAPGRSKM